MVSLTDIPRDSFEREYWLEDYLIGKVTSSMVERLSMQLGGVIRGKAGSPFGREAAERIQTQSREDFSAWIIERMS